MKKVKNSWMAVAVCVLLASTVVGVVWAGPSDRPQAQDITRKVTLTGADFIPADEDRDWNTVGNYVECETGSCVFTAPVVFPCLPAVIVERFKLHVSDDDGLGMAVATMFRTNPSNGVNTFLSVAGSPEGTSGGLRTYTSGEINKMVWPSQKAFIHLSIGTPNIKVYGVTVEYHRNI